MHEITLIELLNNFYSQFPSISKKDIELLLCHGLNIDFPQIHFNLQKKIDEKNLFKIKTLLIRRKKGEPTWKIIGKAPFWKYDFTIDKNVLTPRKETEFLVEIIIDEYKNIPNISSLELGSGSGNISLTIALELPQIKIISFDKSQKALNIANLNKKKLGVDNVDFVKANNFSFLKERKFDLFFSNPPYIKTNDIETLEIEVKNNDPKMALDGGNDGLRFYRFISGKIKKYLVPHGKIFLEIGSVQKNEVLQIFKEKFVFIKCKKDYANHDRIMVFQNFEG